MIKFLYSKKHCHLKIVVQVSHFAESNEDNNQNDQLDEDEELESIVKIAGVTFLYNYYVYNLHVHLLILL